EGGYSAAATGQQRQPQGDQAEEQQDGGPGPAGTEDAARQQRPHVLQDHRDRCATEVEPGEDPQHRDESGEYDGSRQTGGRSTLVQTGHNLPFASVRSAGAAIELDSAAL